MKLVCDSRKVKNNISLPRVTSEPELPELTVKVPRIDVTEPMINTQPEKVPRIIQPMFQKSDWKARYHHF